MIEVPKAPNTQGPKRAGRERRRCGALGIEVLGCLSVLLLLSGCSGRSVELVNVEGYITLDGQPPPGGGTVFFAPYEALGKLPLRPARAYFDSDGFFRAAAFEDADGLIPAKYRVGVYCWEVEPTIGGPPPQSYIPQRYTSAGTSGLELAVTSGAGSITWNVELVSAPE